MQIRCLSLSEIGGYCPTLGPVYTNRMKTHYSIGVHTTVSAAFSFVHIKTVENDGNEKKTLESDSQ